MEYEKIYKFWFNEALFGERRYLEERLKVWFGKKTDFDERIRQDYVSFLDNPELASWPMAPRGHLVAIIVLDQFPRNAFRGTDRAFEYDPRALALAHEAIAKNLVSDMNPFEVLFLLLPLEHSEERADQVESVRQFTALQERFPLEMADIGRGFLAYAQRHHDIIKRFGRFPHRNKALGRESTRDEVAFLRESAGF